MPSSSASLIRIREKNQITLPQEVMTILGLRAPAQVEYKILPDGVLIRPVGQRAPEARLSKIRRLSRPDRGVFQNAAEVDSFVLQLRSE